eukprot:Sspe_Gene.114212::Locus_99703_Transcript_1_1_Confidence_1.000_Length_626::g.114212::m.114212
MVEYALPIDESRLDEIAAVEADSYPADEKADRDALQLRMREAADYFKMALDGDGSLVGYVCSTLTSTERLEEESMSLHDKDGWHLCIHSVVTVPSKRKQGHARKLLLAYLEQMKQLKNVRKISLISKENLCPFYESCGFKLLGPSHIVHGKDTWYDLTMDV